MAAQMKMHPITTALQLETAVIYGKKNKIHVIFKQGCTDVLLM
jgi:hypothetical protein